LITLLKHSSHELENTNCSQTDRTSAGAVDSQGIPNGKQEHGQFADRHQLVDIVYKIQKLGWWLCKSRYARKNVALKDVSLASVLYDVGELVCRRVGMSASCPVMTEWPYLVIRRSFVKNVTSSNIQ